MSAANDVGSRQYISAALPKKRFGKFDTQFADLLHTPNFL
jgi:hypothetical protein